ncbi:MAG TPA: right-handed parallel beta-helix repeat-containing protein [Vicinamibacterales bacterium]
MALPITQALLLDGQPFPRVTPFVSAVPTPKRTLFLAASGPAGDGSETHPWNNLQAALCALLPGDRLRVQKGIYAGEFRIAGACRDGTNEAPIQVSFESATLKSSTDGSPLTITKAFWLIDGLRLDLGELSAPGLSVAGHDITIDHASVGGGRGPGIRVANGASRVTIANTRVQKAALGQPWPDSIGIEIGAGSSEIRVVSCELSRNPAGSLRVDSNAAERVARDLTFDSNSIHDDLGPALALYGGEKIRVVNNTIFYGRERRARSRGIALEGVRDVSIESNHIADAAVAIRVGFADPHGGPFLAPRDVSISRNDIENALPEGTAIDIEAGHRVRVTNNVIERYADAIMVFGAPPQTDAVSIANNLVLAVVDVAFVLTDPKAAAYFDHNVFSPPGERVDVQVGKKTLSLANFLKRGTMPHTQLVKGVTLRNRELSAVDGVVTVDQGKALEGISFKGSAPDIGVAEK